MGRRLTVMIGSSKLLVTLGGLSSTTIALGSTPSSLAAIVREARLSLGHELRREEDDSAMYYGKMMLGEMSIKT